MSVTAPPVKSPPASWRRIDAHMKVTSHLPYLATSYLTQEMGEGGGGQRTDDKGLDAGQGERWNFSLSATRRHWRFLQKGRM